MLTYLEIEKAVEQAMYDNDAVLSTQDVESATFISEHDWGNVYENDWGNWALEDVDGQINLVAIDGEVIEHLEEYDDVDQLYDDVMQFLKETFSA